MLQSRRKSPRCKIGIVVLLLLWGVLLSFNCKKKEIEPGDTLIEFFNLLNQGSYKKAATLCVEDIDPFLLDFTYNVSLRYIDRVIVKEHQVDAEKASYFIYLILKDGVQFVYYHRTKEGYLVPGTMELRKVISKDDKVQWKVVCGEFWETYHWKDISRKIRLNIIKVVERTLYYRDSTEMLPGSLSVLWSEELDSIINPVTGEEGGIATPEKVISGVVTYSYNEEQNEVSIIGYGVQGEAIDYYIVSHARGTEKAELLEFFDVPPRKISMVIPGFPESERMKGIEGIVSLKLLIGRDGMVHEIKVERSLSSVFDSVAVEAVKHSVFSPAKRDRKPVAVWYNFPVRFVIEE